MCIDDGEMVQGGVDVCPVDHLVPASCFTRSVTVAVTATIRLQFDAIRPFDDLRYDRRPIYCGLLQCGLKRWNERKRSERRKHRALTVVRPEPKIFAPPQTPFPGT